MMFLHRVIISDTSYISPENNVFTYLSLHYLNFHAQPSKTFKAYCIPLYFQMHVFEKLCILQNQLSPTSQMTQPTQIFRRKYNFKEHVWKCRFYSGLIWKYMILQKYICQRSFLFFWVHRQFYEQFRGILIVFLMAGVQDPSVHRILSERK